MTTPEHAEDARKRIRMAVTLSTAAAINRAMDYISLARMGTACITEQDLNAAGIEVDDKGCALETEIGDYTLTVRCAVTIKRKTRPQMKNTMRGSPD